HPIRDLYRETELANDRRRCFRTCTGPECLPGNRGQRQLIGGAALLTVQAISHLAKFFSLRRPNWSARRRASASWAGDMCLVSQSRPSVACARTLSVAALSAARLYHMWAST